MTENNCDLSVIIVSHNVRELTRECLKSICDNTKKVSFEIILVDNESSDGSQEMVRQEFPHVHLICNEVGRGLAVANNQGLEISKGRYVLTLNSDTIVNPGVFDTLVKFMDEHPDVGGATPKLVPPDGGKHPDFIGKTPSLKAELMWALSPLHHSFADAVSPARFIKDFDYSKTQEVPCVLWGTVFIVRREVVEMVGPQDPLFFIYAEDADWAMRIAKAGWKLYYVADVSVIHYGGQSTKQDGFKMSAQLLKSKCRLMQKHYGFLAGMILRFAFVMIFAIRMFKWGGVYLFRRNGRAEAVSRVSYFASVIRAVVTY